MNLFLSLSFALLHCCAVAFFFFIHESSMRMWRERRSVWKGERKIGGSGEFTFQKIYAECVEKFFISGVAVETQKFRSTHIRRHTFYAYVCWAVKVSNWRNVSKEWATSIDRSILICTQKKRVFSLIFCTHIILFFRDIYFFDLFRICCPLTL